jgi:sulfate transport system permease protein
MKRAFRPHSILPGFDLTMGFTVFYLSLIVLIPLGATFLKTFSPSFSTQGVREIKSE